MPITISGTTITFNNGTTQTTAGGSGTVTSIATGNGLSGGTITSSGTLVIACPSLNTVGSYITAFTSGSALSWWFRLRCWYWLWAVAFFSGI
jgi:hypothetical protein